MKKKLFVFTAAFFIFSSFTAFTDELTIIHTNDLHSQLSGLAPNADYTPHSLNNDKTLGGWARIAAIIKKTRQKSKGAVLVLDAGDFMMGSLFHTISREHAVELCLLKKMGYDCTTPGNHEFDLMPEGLSKIIRTAKMNNCLPNIVSSNVIFSKKSTKDDSLEKIYSKGLIKPYIILKKANLKIGIFGLMGKHAAEVSPFAKPVTFADAATAALKMVKILKEKEKADIVICLSHSGLSIDPSKSEDELLAEQVSGIDIIISGHTHSRMNRPVTVNNTIIMQSWEYGKQVGILTADFTSGRISIKKYEAKPVDDSIQGDREITKLIEKYQTIINKKILKPYGVSYNTAVAQTDFNIMRNDEESPLGNLISDAILWYANRHRGSDPTPFTGSFESNGIIRDSILKGKTGSITMADLFRVFPMGIGYDGTIGYPLVSFYLNADEIKKGLEILTSIAPIKGPDYFIQISGLRVRYNPRRMLFDRVTDVWIKNKGQYVTLDTSTSNKKLYRFTANMYNAAFFSMIGDFTAGILTISPKDKDGRPYENVKQMLIDRNPGKNGVQEAKEWVAILRYIQNFKDTNGSGIVNIPLRYKKPDGRIMKAPSLNPYQLLRGGSLLTWAAFSAVMLILVLLIFIAVRIRRKLLSKN